jgi:hypothetical protein
MTKTAISIRLDTDVLDWFRRQTPRGYQSKINELLRSYRDVQQAHVQTIVGRAQQIFLQYRARCFWHMREDLKITPELIPVIQQGLRKHGGRDGFRLASELELTKK